MQDGSWSTVIVEQKKMRPSLGPLTLEEWTEIQGRASHITDSRGRRMDQTLSILTYDRAQTIYSGLQVVQLLHDL